MSAKADSRKGGPAMVDTGGDTCDLETLKSRVVAAAERLADAPKSTGGFTAAVYASIDLKLAVDALRKAEAGADLGGLQEDRR